MKNDRPDPKSNQARAAQRNEISLGARLRTISGLRDSALLTNISTHGCSLSSQGLLLDVGKRVIIQPSGLEGIPSIVRWVNGHRAGLEFVSPLYAPIVEDLNRRNPTERTVTIMPIGPKEDSES